MSISLSDLTEIDQFDVCKMLLDGKEPMFHGKRVEIPNMLSARYTCISCGDVMTPMFYKSDLSNISKRVMCSKCMNWSVLHFIGTPVQHEVKKLKKVVQKRLMEFNLEGV